jgi:hypothetical protein
MKQTAQFVCEPVSILEQWFLNMDRALAQRQNLHVQTMDDGSVIAINKYASMSAYLAGREIVGQIEQILSHMRAARRELAARVEQVRSGGSLNIRQLKSGHVQVQIEYNTWNDLLTVLEAIDTLVEPKPLH